MSDSQGSALATIDFPGGQLVTTLIDGAPFVAARPICEHLGIDWSTQRRRLQKASWATVATLPSVAGDQLKRPMVMINRRTLTQWLNVIDIAATHMYPERATALAAYQDKSAAALDAYWHEGGAINPAATVEQLDALSARIVALKAAIDYQAQLVAWRPGRPIPELTVVPPEPDTTIYDQDVECLPTKRCAQEYLRTRGADEKLWSALRTEVGSWRPGPRAGTWALLDHAYAHLAGRRAARR